MMTATPINPSLRPATWPRERADDERLLCVDAQARTFRDARVGDLPGLLRPGDLLVVNDAATLPASLPGTGPGGAAIEVRLLGEVGEQHFRAVLFGAGDWRTPTEQRPAPPPLSSGDTLTLRGGLAATITWVSPEHPRLCELAFDRSGAALWSALYQAGQPVQYAYLRGPLDLWHVQTAYASRPWAVEAPSAGRPLRWGLLLSLRRRGVGLAWLTHGAGLSSTGDEGLDAALPLRERFDIPADTVGRIAQTRAAGGRVIAVGTTVVRALEGCALLHDGALVPGPGETGLRLDGDFHRRVTDGLLTGMHEPTASHYQLLQAFADPDLLDQAYAHAAAAGYLGHEFGDSTLILPAAPPPAA